MRRTVEEVAYSEELAKRLEILNEPEPSSAKVELIKLWLRHQDLLALQNELLDPEVERRYPAGLKRLVEMIQEAEASKQLSLARVTREEPVEITSLAEGARSAFDAKAVRETIQDLMVSSDPERVKRAIRTLSLLRVNPGENADAFVNAYRNVSDGTARAEIIDLFIKAGGNPAVLSALKDLLLMPENQPALERLVNLMVGARTLAEVEEELCVVPLVEALQRGTIPLETRKLVIRELTRIAPAFDKLPEYRERLQVVLINLLQANPKELRVVVSDVFASLGPATKNFLWQELETATHPDVRRLILETLSRHETDEVRREQLARLLVQELDRIVRNVFEEERMQEAILRLGDHGVMSLLSAVKGAEEQKKALYVRTIGLFWERGLSADLSPHVKEDVAAAFAELLDYASEHIKTAILRARIFGDQSLQPSSRNRLVTGLIHSIELFLSNTMVRPTIIERLRESGDIALAPLFGKLRTARFDDERQMILQALSDIIYGIDEADESVRNLIDQITAYILKEYGDKIKPVGRICSSPVVSPKLVQQAVSLFRQKMQSDYHLAPFVLDAFGEMMRRRKDFGASSKLQVARDMASVIDGAKDALAKFNIRSSVHHREFREVAVRVLGNIYLGGQGLAERSSIIRILAANAVKGTMEGCGVNEIENLRQVLSRVVTDPSTPPEDKVEVAMMLRKQPERILQMDYFGDIALSVEGNPELTDLASRIAVLLMEMKVDDPRKKRVVYEILGKLAARRELNTIRDNTGSEIDLRGRIVDALLSGLRAHHMGAREALDTVSRSPHVPAELAQTIANELRRATEVRS